MDGMEVHEKTEEIAEGPPANRFHQWVAIAVALVSVFMAMCKVKDDNIVQAMMSLQAQELDQWNQYQAKSTKQHLDELELQKGRLQVTLSPTLPAAAHAALDGQMAAWQSEVARYDKEKADMKSQAEDSRRQYDALNFRDDQFDFSDALLGLAIALFAVSSLARSRPLFSLALVAAAGGILMGVAAFAQWHIHPGVIRFLT